MADVKFLHKTTIAGINHTEYEYIKVHSSDKITDFNLNKISGYSIVLNV